MQLTSQINTHSSEHYLSMDEIFEILYGFNFSSYQKYFEEEN